jgi:hypothetical protein
MADVEILAQQISAAPLAYVIPGGQEILVKVLAAHFDGTSATNPWQPAIQIVGPSGQVLRTFPLTTALAAGASADVTWFPRGGVSSSGSGGAGIQFDTDNEGGWLDVTTNTQDGAGRGFALIDKSGSDANLIDAPGGGYINIGPNSVNVNIGGGAGGAVSAIGQLIELDALPGYFWAVGSGAGGIQGQFSAGGTLTVYTLPGPVKVFEIRHDGSLHGLTGKTLTFDL